MLRWLSNALIRWLTFERPVEGVPLCDFERIQYELRPADVLLIEGRSRASDIIKNITQSSWSHAALYIGRLHDIENPKLQNLLSSHFTGSPDTQLIIEGIMGKGTIVSSINTYEADHIRLCRPKGLSRRDAQTVIGYAIRRLGTDYDVQHVLDLARFLLPWSILPRRFRSSLFDFHAGKSTRTVCSSMIAEAFNSVEFPILPLVKTHATKGLELITRNPKLFTPRDFDYSPYFEIIKYPFIEFADYAMYRKLPWNREGLVSHDNVGVSGEEVLFNQVKPKISRFKKLKDKFQLNTKKNDPPEPEEEPGKEPEKMEDNVNSVDPSFQISQDLFKHH